MSELKDHNPGGLWAFVISFGLSIGLIFYLSFFDKGVVNLDQIQTEDPDGAPAGGGDAGFDMAAVDQPWQPSDEIIAHGGKVYQMNCAVCHGSEGKGDGPGAAGIAVRNLVEGQWRNGGTRVALYKTLQNGIEGTSMAAFKHIPSHDRWAIVHWIRSITKNAPDVADSQVAEFAKGAD